MASSYCSLYVNFKYYYRTSIISFGIINSVKGTNQPIKAINVKIISVTPTLLLTKNSTMSQKHK